LRSVRFLACMGFIIHAENEQTELAKNNKNDPRRCNIDNNHKYASHNITFMQIGSSIKRFINKVANPNKQVHFAPQRTVRTFQQAKKSVMITYDSGANGNYMAERDIIAINAPILKKSSKRVGVANGEVSKAKYETRLPFARLSPKAAATDTFENFPNSLMSVGKTSDDGTVSIFTKDGVTVVKEEDV
jgi:hypothetical protein